MSDRSWRWMVIIVMYAVTVAVFMGVADYKIDRAYHRGVNDGLNEAIAIMRGDYDE